jgi:hypothetical protein
MSPVAEAALALGVAIMVAGWLAAWCLGLPALALRRARKRGETVRGWWLFAPTVEHGNGWLWVLLTDRTLLVRSLTWGNLIEASLGPEIGVTHYEHHPRLRSPCLAVATRTKTGVMRERVRLSGLAACGSLGSLALALEQAGIPMGHAAASRDPGSSPREPE